MPAACRLKSHRIVSPPFCLQAGLPASARSQPRQQQPRSVGWLASFTASEALPGRGLKCWLACPEERLGGLVPAPAALGACAVWPLAAADASTDSSCGCDTLEALVPETPHMAPEPPHRVDAGTAASSAAAGGNVSAAASSGRRPVVEVKVAIGNRRLMQEEGVTLSAQASR